jgi:transglutaminase-like putative cysteine protease
MELEPYLAPAEFVDSGDPGVEQFAGKVTAGSDDDVSRAVKLYYAVRDEILYDPYYGGEARRYFRASDCLRAKRGFCIPKAALLAAAARCLGIPARLAFADVRNHLSTKKLLELMGGDIFIWHSLTELYLEGRWVKATPAFNLSLCQRFGVHPLEFDGRRDSLFHEYDQAGRKHMEYLRERGHYSDVPYQSILADLRETYPRWMKCIAENQGGAFASEA